MATIEDRKEQHLRLAARADVASACATGLGDLRLRHRALPGRDLADVELATTLLGARLAAPLLVSAMTGGTARAATVNARLAAAAARHGIAMALGSGRALLDDPSLRDTYTTLARPPLLLANLGVGGLTPDRAGRLVELLGADGLTIHLNGVQEAVQPEGATSFAGAGERIAETVAALAPLPVMVKEVGFGLDAEDVRELRAAGVAAIDVAGAGGTNWATIEGRRDLRAGAVADAFADWGVPTATAVRQAVGAAGDVPVVASGGLRDGVDVAKGLALGAVAGGIARPLLAAALDDDDEHAVDAALGTVVEQLRIAIWATGAPSARAMDATRLAA